MGDSKTDPSQIGSASAVHLAGRVLDRWGESAVGAQVLVQLRDENTADWHTPRLGASVATNAEGSWNAAIPIGPTEVSIHAVGTNGDESPRVFVPLAEGAATREVVLVLREMTDLRLSVTFSDGRPADGRSGARAWVAPSRTWNAAAGASTALDQRGQHTFRVPTGGVTVSAATAEGLRRGTYVHAEIGRTTDVALVLPLPEDLRWIRLRSSGLSPDSVRTPVRRVRVFSGSERASGLSQRIPWPEGATEIVMPVLKAGKLQIDPEVEGCVAATWTWPDVRTLADGQVLDLELGSGFQGDVHLLSAETHSPLPGVRLELRREGEGPRVTLAGDASEVGVVRVAAPPGRYVQVRPRLPDRSPEHVVSLSAARTRLDLLIAAHASVGGTYLGPEGGREGAWVLVFRGESSAARRVGRFRVESGAWQGTVAVPVGTPLRFQAATGSRAPEQAVVHGTAGALDIALRASAAPVQRLVIRVRRRDGSIAHGDLLLDRIRPDGESVERWARGEKQPAQPYDHRASVDPASQSAVFHDIESGLYRAHWLAEGKVLDQEAVAVDAPIHAVGPDGEAEIAVP